MFHGGHKIRILKNGLFHQELFVTPEFVLDFQSNFRRLNFGTYFVDGIFDLGFGIDTPDCKIRIMQVLLLKMLSLIVLGLEKITQNWLFI